jgi:23S rRNA U2552 (ribose-2'-O)-methylase RlmE/FtsJ
MLQIQFFLVVFENIHKRIIQSTIEEQRMLIHTLPSLSGNYWNKISLSQGTTIPTQYISYSLHKFLTEIKCKIDERVEEWDAYKKYTNPYEYIHSSNNRSSICKYRPISRAFFKLVEIINNLKIPQFDDCNKPIKIFGLAEGPGGFIEAARYYNKNPDSQFYGMTIEDPTNQDVPGWKKAKGFLKHNENVILEKGADGTGDILKPHNFKYVVEKYRGSIDFITGDGGFDFSLDFNNQELTMTNLLFAQVAYALCIQKRGGCFVLKMFDSFYKPTVEILFLLASMYERVHIVKPNTSRAANSERYIVCMNYKLDPDEKMENMFASVLTEMNHGFYVRSLLGIKVPMCFYNKIEEINVVFGQNQLDNIYTTLGLIEMRAKKEKIDYYNKQNIQKCINWCIRHNFEYNNMVIDEPGHTSNMFLCK